MLGRHRGDGTLRRWRTVGRTAQEHTDQFAMSPVGNSVSVEVIIPRRRAAPVEELGSDASKGRFRLIAVDQALSGGSNVLVAIAAAHVLPASEFGYYGIVAMIYIVALGIVRALVNDPVLVHPTEAKDRRPELIGANLSLGVLIGLVVALAGLGTFTADRSMGAAMIILGVCMPGLALQDLGRYLGFVYQLPGRAVFLDLLWLILIAAALPVLAITHTHSLPVFVGAWATAGVLSALVIVWQYRRPFLRGGLRWLRFTWWFSWRYLISYVATQATALGAFLWVSVVAGRTALGGLQGSVLLVRPYGLFQAAVVASSVSEIARSEATGSQVRSFALRRSWIATSAALVNAAVMILLPTSLGRLALGNSWDAAKPLLLATGVQIVFLGLQTGFRAALLGRRDAQYAVRLDVCATVLTMTAIAMGASLNGAVGAVWGATIIQAGAAVVWWLTLWARTRED